MPTRRAPLGYVKPWHRGTFPSVAGYSLCCKQPEYDLSVLAFERTLAHMYFEPSIVLGKTTQARIRSAADRAGDDWKSWVAERHLHVVQSVHPQVVVLNHLENDQVTRVFERWAARRPVRGPSDFPDMIAAYDRVPSVIRGFRRSPAALIRYLRRTAGVLLSRPLTPRRRWDLLVTAITAPIWFITGLPEKNARWGFVYRASRL